MKNDFSLAKNRSSGLSNLRQVFTAFRYVASIRLPSCLCSADLSVSIVLHCYCYRSEVMCFEAVEVRLMSKDIHFKAFWALSITGDAQTCMFLKICSLRLPAVCDVTAGFQLKVEGEGQRCLAVMFVWWH